MRPLQTVRPIFTLAFILSSPVGLNAQVATADAQGFLGAWEAEMEAAQGGTFDFDILLRDQAGALAGEVTNPQGDTNAIQEFVKAGESLILRYSVNFGGQRSDIQVTLAPSPEDRLMVILEMDGAGFAADGIAARVEPEPPQ
jgi:hypothetical protein